MLMCYGMLTGTTGGSGSGSGALTGTGTIWPWYGGGYVSFVTSGTVTGQGNFSGCGTLVRKISNKVERESHKTSVAFRARNPADLAPSVDRHRHIRRNSRLSCPHHPLNDIVRLPPDEDRLRLPLLLPRCHGHRGRKRHVPHCQQHHSIHFSCHHEPSELNGRLLPSKLHKFEQHESESAVPDVP